METFDLKIPCPKCGSADLAHRFRRAGERIDDMFGDPYESASQDLMRTFCRTCGFHWSRMPLNGVEEKAKTARLATAVALLYAMRCEHHCGATDMQIAIKQGKIDQILRLLKTEQP